VVRAIFAPYKLQVCLALAASADENPEITSTLVKAGAKLDDKDTEGMTSLMFAAACNQNPDLTMTLLKAGANGKLRSSDGKTALDCAANNDKLRGTDALKALQLTGK
jgi:ankyrin repeat protein